MEIIKFEIFMPEHQTSTINDQTSGYLEMDLLRFTTAGSVDDGKSTLIGRLLYDSKSIFEDQYEAVKASSEQRGEESCSVDRRIARGT